MILKKSATRRSAALVLAVVTLIALPAAGAPSQTGSQVQPFTAKDQHEQVFTLKPSEVRFLMASHDMETGKQANAALTAMGKDYLGSKSAVYIANIHGMPGIGRMFALPKMRKYSHRIILGDDAALIARFPEQKGKVTVLKLTGGKVVEVHYWQPGAQKIDDVLK